MVFCSSKLIEFSSNTHGSNVRSYEYAIIGLPNGEVVEGRVSSWTDFEDGDQIQVKIDGKTYLVHSSNVVLISNGLENQRNVCYYDAENPNS